MKDLSGRYYIDGADIWIAYNLFVESGSDGFLNYASKKDGITHDWKDAGGIDVDLTKVFLGPRDITLNCAILSISQDDFWNKYMLFINTMTQPGFRRIQVAEFGQRSFFCFYKECKNYHRFTRIKDADDNHQIACKLSVTFTETNPAPDSSDVFIVDDQGRFLIT